MNMIKLSFLLQLIFVIGIVGSLFDIRKSPSTATVKYHAERATPTEYALYRTISPITTKQLPIRLLSSFPLFQIDDNPLLEAITPRRNRSIVVLNPYTGRINAVLDLTHHTTNTTHYRVVNHQDEMFILARTRTDDIIYRTTLHTNTIDEFRVNATIPQLLASIDHNNLLAIIEVSQDQYASAIYYIASIDLSTNSIRYLYTIDDYRNSLLFTFRHDRAVVIFLLDHNEPVRVHLRIAQNAIEVSHDVIDGTVFPIWVFDNYVYFRVEPGDIYRVDFIGSQPALVYSDTDLLSFGVINDTDYLLTRNDSNGSELIHFRTTDNSSETLYRFDGLATILATNDQKTHAVIIINYPSGKTTYALLDLDKQYLVLEVECDLAMMVSCPYFFVETEFYISTVRATFIYNFHTNKTEKFRSTGVLVFVSQPIDNDFSFIPFIIYGIASTILILYLCKCNIN